MKDALKAPAARRLACVACALWMAVSSGCRDGAHEPVANLLVVSLDTTRADRLGLYGYDRDTSPALDALARRGQRFDAAQTVMTTTLPAHLALFTSLHPRQLGVLRNGVPVPEEALTLAERLAARGFETAAFVSAAPLSSKLGIDQGFALYDEPLADERIAGGTRERAEAWLAERAADPERKAKRFFAFVHFFDAHVWYTPPAAYRERFGAPLGVQPYARGFVPDPSAFTASVRADAAAAYDGELRYVDDELGRLLAALEEHGLADDTLVIVLADHGETLDELLDERSYGYDHGEFLHRRELRVPLIVAPPARLGYPAGAVYGDVVSLLDVLPTAFELLDVPLEPPFVGRSLVPLFAGGTLAPLPAFAERRALTRAEQERPPVPELAGQELAIATADWLFVLPEGRPRELYALGGGPDVAAREPQVAAELEAAVRGLARQHAAVRERDEALDPELAQALRALGYTTDGGGDPEARPEDAGDSEDPWPGEREDRR